MTLDVGKCPTCHPIVSKINKLWQKCHFSHKSSVSQNRHGRQKVAIFLTFRFRRHFLSKNVWSNLLIWHFHGRQKPTKIFFAHMEPQFICVLTCVASLIHDFANDHFTSSKKSVCYYTSGLWCSIMTESSESKQNAVWIRAYLYLRHRQVSICILPRFSVNIW